MALGQAHDPCSVGIVAAGVDRGNQVELARHLHERVNHRVVNVVLVAGSHQLDGAEVPLVGSPVHLIQLRGMIQQRIDRDAADEPRRAIRAQIRRDQLRQRLVRGVAGGKGVDRHRCIEIDPTRIVQK